MKYDTFYIIYADNKRIMYTDMYNFIIDTKYISIGDSSYIIIIDIICIIKNGMVISRIVIRFVSVYATVPWGWYFLNYILNSDIKYIMKDDMFGIGYGDSKHIRYIDIMGQLSGQKNQVFIMNWYIYCGRCIP